MPEIRVSGNFKNFEGRLKAARQEFRDCLDAAMVEAIQLGVETGKDKIETSGTVKSGKRGRIKTGTMLNEFKGNVDIGRAETVGRVGWAQRREDYFLYQELGFAHYLSGEEIDGMLALKDATEETWELLRDRFSMCTSQFVRGI